MTTMLVSDVVTRVRRTFGDEAAVQVQDADIIRWINDAQIEIVKRNDAALQTTSLINIVANQATYTLPTDLFILRSLRYKYTDMLSFANLPFKNLQEFDDTIDGWDGSAYATGNPQIFTMDDGKAILFPTPDRSVTSGLKVRYNQRPTDVTLTSSAIALPDIYHPTIVKYCMYQASLMDEDNEPAVLYKNDFNADLDQLQTRETQMATTTYPVITVLDFDQ